MDVQYAMLTGILRAFSVEAERRPNSTQSHLDKSVVTTAFKIVNILKALKISVHMTYDMNSTFMWAMPNKSISVLFIT